MAVTTTQCRPTTGKTDVFGMTTGLIGLHRRSVAVEVIGEEIEAEIAMMGEGEAGHDHHDGSGVHLLGATLAMTCRSQLDAHMRFQTSRS